MNLHFTKSLLVPPPSSLSGFRFRRESLQVRGRRLSNAGRIELAPRVMVEVVGCRGIPPRLRASPITVHVELDGQCCDVEATDHHLFIGRPAHYSLCVDVVGVIE